MRTATRSIMIGSLCGAVVVVALGAYIAKADGTAAAPKPAAAVSQDSVDLTDLQLKSVKVVTATDHEFAVTSAAVGYIDFNQDHTAPVFAPYQGVIKQVFVAAGDTVRKGQALFSIQSPDLVQAESTLIAAAGVLKLTTKTLERAKAMLTTQASSQKDVEQATSDQQTAEGAYKAARDALHIFGKSDSEIDAIASSRHTDGELTVLSPFAGQVTARSAAPGVLAQPGTAPAPITVSDLSSVWMVANVTESDSPKLRLGEPVAVTVDAWGDRQFKGTVTNIAAALDPVAHRVAVRSVIANPDLALHPQMLATFSIQTAAPSHLVSIPDSGVVREGDGTITVFVTKDQHHFTRRVVQLGAEQGGLYPILSGLHAGELVASDGALFISNALALQVGGSASDD